MVVCGLKEARKPQTSFLLLRLGNNDRARNNAKNSVDKEGDVSRPVMSIVV